MLAVWNPIRAMNYIEAHNDGCEPFVRTKSADVITEKVERARKALNITD